MKCPFCRSARTEVYNTRTTKFAAQIWRRRRCLSCRQSFTTYEAADMSFLHVTRPSAPKRRYSRSQLFSSLLDAFPAATSPGTVEALTDTVEAKVLDLQNTEVTTAELAAIVLTTLKYYNTASFVRYLSSHADLASSAQLKRELKKY